MTQRTPGATGPTRSEPTTRTKTRAAARPGFALVMILVLALAAALAAPGPAAAQDRPLAFDFQDLVPGVIAAVVDPEVPSYAFANSLIVIGEDGVLVVDTQQSPRPAQQVLAEIRRRTELPVRWVVNTHAHADHFWGNQVYADTFPDVEIIATRATRDSMVASWDRQIAEQREHTAGTLGRLRDMLADETNADRKERIEAAITVRNRYMDDLDALRLTPPDRVVDGRLNLDLGGREVVLFAAGPAHSPGDLVVWLPDHDVIMVGDLLEQGDLWLDGADIVGWTEALSTIAALEPATLVMGHGAVQSDLTLLQAERAQLGELLQEDPPGGP